MKRTSFTYAWLPFSLALCLAACQVGPAPATRNVRSVVVTYSILGAVVKDLVGDKANVIVLVPNGADPHEWEPSARDIETVNKADLIVQNGLGLEAGLQKTLEGAASRGVKTFVTSEHVTVRKVGKGEGIPLGDLDQAAGAPDPHLWTDPLTIRDAVAALSIQLRSDLGIDQNERALAIENRLESLDKELSGLVSTLPAEDRKLVTGHESMGYFAQRYGFRLVGAIIPSITTQAEVSAFDLAALRKIIDDNKVKAVFTELGTSPAVAEAIGRETGVKVVQLTTHALPPDGSYFTFERNMATVIVEGLKQPAGG